MSAPLLKVKQTTGRKRLRPARIESHSAPIAEDSHAWAVSYADFLMVLLSFFIIFFSVDSEKRANLIESISAEAASGSGGSGIANAVASSTLASVDPKALELPRGADRKLPIGISKAVNGSGIKLEGSDGSGRIRISFEDDIYPPGKVELPRAQADKLRATIEKLRPFLGAVNVTFIGHTDAKPLRQKSNRYLKDNFALSSLRATNALQIAAGAGADPSRLYAKGAAENSRGTRTLTLLITPLESEP